MIYPKFLKENDCIGVPATSAGADTIQRQSKMLNAERKLEQLKYRLKVSENLLKCKNGRSAGAKERAEELNNMFQDNDINMILTATGGEFLVEILPYVKFDLIKNNPKIVAGFSDSTGILYPITTKYDIATIYGQNFSSFGSNEWHKCQNDFWNIVTGKENELRSYELFEEEYTETVTGLEGYNLTGKVEWKTLDDKPVHLSGRMIGGCLDVITHLAGTKYDGINEFNERYKDDGIIWFFDNCELSMEETIRTLWKLNELEYFKYTKGIIFGRFGVNTTYFEYNVKTCLQDSVLNSLNIPIIYDTDITHRSPCMPIINGAMASVDVEDGKGKIRFELK